MLVMREIIYSEQAKKFLTKMSKNDARKLLNKIEQYASNPEELKNHVKKLVGVPCYRLRVGDYRIVFGETGEVLLIIKIGMRGNIYRGL